MKPKSIKSLLALALLAPGALFAQTTAKTTPVGYETLEVVSGFNYLGLRLHQPIIASGTLETVGSGSVADTGATFTVQAGKTYILEINNASGVISQFLGSAVAGDTITTADNLSLAGVTAGASYSIRESATLASVFGLTNSAGLEGGFGGITGADVVFVPNGSGFDQYYFDTLEESWADVNGVAVNGAEIPLVYADGVVVSANNPLTLTVSGEVKKFATLLATSSGFNYLSSIYPAGATLASTFGGAVAQLDQGFAGITGADVFFVPNSTGGLDQYYYDSLEESWADVNGVAIDATTVILPSGVVFANEGGPLGLVANPPSTYSSL
jgi:hypothetical protein